jgi:hypothetical protein
MSVPMCLWPTRLGRSMGPLAGTLGRALAFSKGSWALPRSNRPPCFTDISLKEGGSTPRYEGPSRAWSRDDPGPVSASESAGHCWLATEE